MDYFRSKAEVREVIVKILPTQLSREYTSLDNIAIAINTRTTIAKLKYILCGLTGVPYDRILLVLCGKALGPDKALIPEDAFEPITIVDEDVNKFRPHIFLSVMRDNKSDDEGEIAENQEQEKKFPESDGVTFDDADNENKKLRKRRYKSKNPYENFDIMKELAAADCEKFSEALINAGFDNEGAFAYLTVEDLQAPGLWIPKTASERILSQAKEVHKRMVLSMTQRRTAGREVADEMLAANKLKTVALGGDSAGNQFVTRADMRRAWHEATVKKGKDSLEVMKGDGAEPDSNTRKKKELPPELCLRMEQIKRQCADVAAAAEAEFEGITGLLNGASTGIYRRIGKDSRFKHNVKGNQIENKEALKLKIRAHRTAVNASRLPITDARIEEGNALDDNKIALVKRVKMKMTDPHRSSKVDGDITTPACIARAPRESLIKCCQKHCEMVMRNREEYILRRRVSNELELKVQMEQLSSYSNGFIKRETLQSIVHKKLASFHGVPSRTLDPSVTAKALTDSLLSLTEQRELIVWLQKKEAVNENLASVVPTVLYSPQKFVTNFVDLLEQFDRERM